jgi:hypothetical protein
MAKTKQNDYYDHVIPVRLTELQAHELNALAQRIGVTVNHLVRDELESGGNISHGPEPKARKGFGKASK